MKKPVKSAPSPGSTASDYQKLIGYLLGAISNVLATGGTRLFHREFGIGLAEARLMYVLGFEGVLTARRASQIIGVDKAATSRTLASLERRGLVKLRADSTDARQRVIEFTKAGKALQERLTVVVLDREAVLVSIFSPDEARTLSNLLQRLNAFVPTIRRSMPAKARRRKPRAPLPR